LCLLALVKTTPFIGRYPCSETVFKTSVLFIQTWNEDQKAGPVNPRVDRYPIFFAASERSGKDNSGNYVYRIGLDNAAMLDTHGHMIVEHDLSQVAEAFIAWGKQNSLPFCEGVS